MDCELKNMHNFLGFPYSVCYPGAMMMKDWTSKEIKALRHKVGLTQVKFKDYLGISLTYLQFLEIGMKKSPSKTLRILLSKLEREYKAKGGIEIG